MGIDTDGDGLDPQQGPAGHRRRGPARAGLARPGQLPELRADPDPAGLRRDAGRARRRGQGAELRTGTTVTGPVSTTQRPGGRRRGHRRPGQGAAARTGRRWSSRPTACPAGSRWRWAWPSATDRPIGVAVRRYYRSPRARRRLPGVVAGAARQERRRQAAARLRLDLRDGRRPGQRRAWACSTRRSTSARATTGRCCSTGWPPPRPTGG